eukprot:CAMPEP_0119045664 /NCGR_PEP_ID=MMETSP1177-20130426/41808_1 /TAXON_ID=2985 /ORGANISM="Ochromonas sp, Strain CCMP1899" /LENGTH=647 /DNA_ID=CAMNT_0007017851 /DNA_START=96 /DNA_END=2036 /DNA_ORIENTATION=-
MNRLSFSHGSEVYEIIDNNSDDFDASTSPIYWKNDMTEDEDNEEDNHKDIRGNKMNGYYRADDSGKNNSTNELHYSSKGIIRRMTEEAVSVANNDRLKPVEQLDLLSGKVVHRYSSVSCAARIMKTSMENISLYCRGNQSLEQLYGWRYVEGGGLAPGWNKGLPSVESLLGVIINDLTGDDKETFEIRMGDGDKEREGPSRSAADEVGDRNENEEVRRNSLTRSKPVEMLDERGVVVQRFPSIHNAGEVMRICRRRISECLSHPITSSTGKFTWRLYKSPIEFRDWNKGLPLTSDLLIMSTSKGHSKRESEQLGSKRIQRPLRPLRDLGHPQRLRGRERRHRTAALDHNYKEAETEDDHDTEDDDENDDDDSEEDDKDDKDSENNDDNDDGNSLHNYIGDNSSQEGYISDDLLQDDDNDNESSSSEDEDGEDGAYKSCGKRKRTTSRSPEKCRKSERLRIPVIDLTRTSKANETTGQISNSSGASSNPSRVGSRIGDCHRSTESSSNRDVSGDTCQSSISGDYSYLSICSPDELTSLSALSQSGFRRFFPEEDSKFMNQDKKKHEEGSQDLFSADRSKSSRKKDDEEEYLSASKVSGCTPVVQMDLNNNVLHRYASETIAANLMGICRKKISLCCDGRLESTGRFRW